MTFDEALKYLLGLGHETLAMKLGLRNTELLLHAFHRPESSFVGVQIAGTNGKGSTARMLESICLAAGLKTGLYTSPHLISITERIRINGREITRPEFARLTERVWSVSRALVAAGQLETLPTFFEQATIVALDAFRDAEVEIAILETGLGGRLDATTAAGAPIIGITAVALDHQEYLGDTIAEIASEKAAIIRPGVTAIIAPQNPEARRVILDRCDAVGVVPRYDDIKATMHGADSEGRLKVTFTTPRRVYEGIDLALRGRHQVTNAAVAIGLAESLADASLEVEPNAIARGLSHARHPGRLEVWPGEPSVLFDGAHNPAGAQALAAYLEEFVHAPITIVFGGMRDKDLAAMVGGLFRHAHHMILTRPTCARAASPEEIARSVAATTTSTGNVTLASSIGEAWRAALDVTPRGGLICVTGSLYLVGEFQAMLSESRVAGRNVRGGS